MRNWLKVNPMLLPDLIKLASSSFLSYRMHSFLTGLGIAIGINIITVQPGKTQT